MFVCEGLWISALIIAQMHIEMKHKVKKEARRKYLVTN